MDALDDYERQIRLLRDEVSYLSTEKAMLQERYTCTHHTHANAAYSRTGATTTQNNVSSGDVVSRCFSLGLPQVGEKSFSESFAEAQSLFQPFEERVTHQSSAH